jgi:hypothetical protein
MIKATLAGVNDNSLANSAKTQRICKLGDAIRRSSGIVADGSTSACKKNLWGLGRDATTTPRETEEFPLES